MKPVNKDLAVKPVMKWAGGNRQLLPVIRKERPKGYSVYYEPFLGGGAVLFDLRPRKAVVNDINEELINVYRVNQSGEFDVPFGDYKNPNIVKEEILRAMNNYFNRAAIAFKCTDFTRAIEGAEAGSFVYLDQPYDPVSASANFTVYDRDGFGRSE